MKRAFIIALVGGALAALTISTALAADGRAVFEQQNCAMCHGVQAAGIAAKAPKMGAPDLSGYEWPGSVEEFVAFLAKERQHEGKDHKIKKTLTAAEAQAVLDWLKAAK